MRHYGHTKALDLKTPKPITNLYTLKPPKPSSLSPLGSCRLQLRKAWTGWVQKVGLNCYEGHGGVKDTSMAEPGCLEPKRKERIFR